MGSFWLWGWRFFLTLPDRLSCQPFIYMVHFEFEFTLIRWGMGDVRAESAWRLILSMKITGYAKVSRLDAPGVLHHVMGRGIERKNIFRRDIDRNDYIGHLSALAQDGAMEIWACASIRSEAPLVERDKPPCTTAIPLPSARSGQIHQSTAADKHSKWKNQAYSVEPS